MPFFVPTQLNIGLWALIGALICVVIGVLIWRITKGKRRALEKIKLNPIKSTNLTTQIALGMNLTFGYRTLANILVKNRYAKAGYSLIPVAVEHNGIVFIIGNVLDGTTTALTVGKMDGKLNAWVQQKKGPQQAIDWAFSYFHDWERYIKGLGFPVKIVKIVPCLGRVNIEHKEPSYLFVKVEDIGKQINELSPASEKKENVDSNEDGGLFVTLGDLNMFAKKGQVPRRLARKLME